MDLNEDVTTCSSLKINLRFGGTYRLYLQGRRWRRYVPSKRRLTFNGRYIREDSALHNHLCENLKTCVDLHSPCFKKQLLVQTVYAVQLIVDTCEHGSIKCLEILQQLSACWLVKKDSAGWSQVGGIGRSPYTKLKASVLITCSDILPCMLMGLLWIFHSSSTAGSNLWISEGRDEKRLMTRGIVSFTRWSDDRGRFIAMTYNV
jgi:hypothetical protein